MVIALLLEPDKNVREKLRKRMTSVGIHTICADNYGSAFERLVSLDKSEVFPDFLICGEGGNYNVSAGNERLNLDEFFKTVREIVLFHHPGTFIVGYGEGFKGDGKYLDAISLDVPNSIDLKRMFYRVAKDLF